MKLYQKVLLISISLLGTLNLSAQHDQLLKFFDQFQGTDGFTTVYITPKMFELFSDIETNDEDFNEVSEAIGMLKGVRILVLDSVGSLTYNPVKLYDEVTNAAEKISYEELMIVKDGDTNVKFLIREQSKIIEEVLLLVGAEDNFVFISLMGNIDLKKLSALSKSMDVEGLDYLEELENY